MYRLEPPYPLIRDLLSQGLVIPFLGSAASLKPSSGVWDQCLTASSLKTLPSECYLTPKCAGFTPPPLFGLPMASELACYLARRINFPPDESPDLTRVAQYVDVIGGRSSLYKELRSIFDQDYEPSPIHYLLAEVEAPLLIVTTNYDDLIERAFDKHDREYDVVVHTTDPKLGNYVLWVAHGQTQPIRILPNKLDIELDKRSIIYKMHGAIDRANSLNDQYVITEDDYINFLTRMTKGKVIPSIFSEPFQTRSFLFIGHGLHDWNLRIVLNRLEQEMRKSVIPKVSWAIQFKPSVIEQRFWRNRGVEVFDLPIEDFVSKILAIS